ncbi:MAG: McrC family protein [Paludibacteraceae bacterium]|nr:McrC family protein [Paludibacteraceae bacterium]
MKVIQFQEQMLGNTIIQQDDASAILPFLEDGKEVVYSVRRGREQNELCFKLVSSEGEIKATGSYFVGIDWLKEHKVAIQVNPKMNNGFEIDYVRMLNDALCEPENFEHLKDLVTIHFDKPSIRVTQQQDLLSIFLVTEYLNLLQRIIIKGLKKSYYVVEENIENKVKGKILIGKNIHQNLVKGRITNNVCRYQVYDIDTPENRILKKALYFCCKQLEFYKHIETTYLEKKCRFIKPYFNDIGDEISLKTIKTYKGNPIFKEYNQALEFAQLLLRRFSYNISVTGKQEIDTPPFWIDMSKLFELYVFHHLRQIFTNKSEIKYHISAHYQELDFLLNPTEWPEPYIIDAKYKPRYKSQDISIDDAREISGYARLRSIYKNLGLNEDTTLPIKCLIIYPDQDKDERFLFTRTEEPLFDKVSGYVRFYKVGIKLPEIKQA